MSMATRKRPKARSAAPRRRKAAPARKAVANARSARRAPVAKPDSISGKPARLDPQLADCRRELTEALAREAATAEILRVISRSPSDVQPVLDAVAETAARLCHAHDVVIRLVDGTVTRVVAHYGPIPLTVTRPRVLTRGSIGGRAIVDARTVHIPDITEPHVREEYPETGALAGQRTFLSVPLIRDGTGLGSIVMRRLEVRPFTDRQIKLLETFAAQAVIAIENVRLFNETKEALEQQTATAEILKVISSSPTDLQPVFDAILEKAIRLCDAHMGHLGLYDGEKFQNVARRGASAEYARYLIERGAFRPPPGGGFARMIAERQPIQIADAMDSPAYRDRIPNVVELVKQGGARTYIIVPMLKEGRVVGGITIYRPEVRPFTQKQIDLVSTFASQAVIAIENVRLFKDLRARNVEVTEALEQQTATADILKVISSSLTDTQPVFDAIAKSGVRLFGGLNVSIRLVAGDYLEQVASTLAVDHFRVAVGDGRFPATRAMQRREPVNVADILAEEWIGEESRDRARQRGTRSLAFAPMLRGGEPIGTISVVRATPGLFTEKQIALLQTFADQAVIAIENVRLFKELQARNVEVTEALEQQTATADILKVISSSPTDTQPVFEAVAESAARLCGADDVVIRLVDGTMNRAVAHHGPIPVMPPRVIARESLGGRAIIDARTVHIPDVTEAHVLEEYPDTWPAAAGHRTFLAVPLIRQDRAIGLTVMRRQEVRPFTDKQIKLLETFAAQAVIAIENVRLFNETKEALEQQTVISGILRAISASPTDTQPVFDAIVQSGVRLFGGMNMSLRLVKGDHSELVASTLPLDGTGDTNPVPLADDRANTSRAILRREVVQIPDIQVAEEWVGDYVKQRAAQRGWRASLNAPLLRENSAIGTILVTRATPGPFTDKQIALLQTFASQAVIAIENVRLFNETKEALEQQTAMSEILRVISSSPTDLQPVFDTILENAARLCDAHMANLRLYEGDRFRSVAQRGITPEFAKWLAEESHKHSPQPEGAVGRMIAEKRPIHVLDRRESPTYLGGHPPTVALVDLGGVRTFLAVPMLKEGRVVGAISVHRPEVRAFTQKQIDLVSTFASQAVIAIENVRLFKELQARNVEVTEALEQQTATADILKVISGSPTDTQPVFDAVAESAARLCAADDVVIRLVEGNDHRAVAHHGPIPVIPPAVLTRASVSGRAILDATTVNVPDVTEAHAREEYPESTFTPEVRSYLAVPLIREGRAIGVILPRRLEVRPFTDKQIKLLETFAAQAVIAIENVRLFNETKEALEQQTVISEILRVIGSSPTDTQPVFDAIVQSGVRLFGGMNMSLRLVKGDHSELMASTLPLDGTGDTNPVPLADDRTAMSRAILRREVVQIPDIQVAEEWVGDYVKQRAAQRGWRASLHAPLLRENSAIGTILVTRSTPGPFTDKQVALLKTFADQAVIAIENVRLFKELQARNAEVTEALQQQTATSEILRVISSSPTDVQPVFDAIAESAAHLCDANDVVIRRVEGDAMLPVAHFGSVPVSARVRPLSRRIMVGRAILEGRTIHVPDCTDPRAREEYPDSNFANSDGTALRTMLAAPLLREGSGIGAILIRREHAQPFSDKQIKLLETFAAQAVIAIENVRLFNETKEALERQTATSEILRVISSSPTDIQPVFDAILENATRLCDAHIAGLRLYEGERFRIVAQRGISPEFAKWIAEESHKYSPQPDGPIGRMIAEKRPIHVLDRRESPTYRAGHPPTVAQVELGGVRTFLAVPMLKEGRVVGAIAIQRQEVRAFTQKQIDLVSTFASQAVIAIENVRLFKELQARNVEVTEALEQQTATADILKVISSSPTDTQPVFDSILQSATRLCDAHRGALHLFDDESRTLVAEQGASAALAESRIKAPLHPGPLSGLGQLIAGKCVIHIADLAETPGYAARDPLVVASVDLDGTRTYLAVPMLKEGTLLGAITFRRQEVRPFTDQQIALLQTFAEQAVIAIENVRLFKELQARNTEITESLEQQTVTAEILKVISSSPTDTQPVFEAIVKSGVHLFGGTSVGLRVLKGDRLERVAFAVGASSTVIDDVLIVPPPLTLNEYSFSGRAVVRREVVHAADVFAADWTGEATRDLARRMGWRACVAAPLLREGNVLGVINVTRAQPVAFGDKEIALLETFADQAVIAIENVRLFKELQERNADVTESLNQQTATAEVLKVISRSTFDLQPVLETLVENAQRLCDATTGLFFRFDGEVFRLEVAHNANPEYVAYRREHPILLNHDTLTGRAALERRPVHVHDVMADPDYKGDGARRKSAAKEPFYPCRCSGKALR